MLSVCQPRRRVGGLLPLPTTRSSSSIDLSVGVLQNTRIGEATHNVVVGVSDEAKVEQLMPCQRLMALPIWREASMMPRVRNWYSRSVSMPYSRSSRRTLSPRSRPASVRASKNQLLWWWSPSLTTRPS
eukprot:TRINITY_DN27292_c0_g1_i1.p2 TRINITY_DN27292_c0_g1~~TRINITY_DN27292_c0_g1_i1.p2  ORF type:complete len:129 (+),score=27.85 TRINITY_DN27292_c0_g1_i1:290-676(+)